MNPGLFTKHTPFQHLCALKMWGISCLVLTVYRFCTNNIGKPALPTGQEQPQRRENGQVLLSSACCFKAEAPMNSHERAVKDVSTAWASCSQMRTLQTHLAASESAYLSPVVKSASSS